MSNSTTRYLIAILAVGFGLRLALALHQSASLESLPDQQEYVALGRSLHDRGSLGFVDARFNQEVIAYRLPGYPALLALIPSSWPTPLIARLAQACIDLSTVIAVYLIARRLSAADNALIAAGLMSANPFYIYFSSLLLTETVFASLITWALYCLIARRWSLAICFLLASCYVRPTGFLLLPVLATAGFANPVGTVAYRWSGIAGRAVVAMTISLALLIFAMLPWAVRNHQRLGRIIWTTTNDGITLYDGFHTGATGGSDQRFAAQMSELKSMNEVQRSDYLTRLAREWIESNWSAVPILTVRKLLRGWSPLPLSRDFARPIYRAMSVSYALPFDVLVLIGLWSRRLERRTKFLLILPAVIVTLGQMLTVGSIRYRMPAEAPLAVLAAVGLSVLFSCLVRTQAKIEHRT